VVKSFTLRDDKLDLDIHKEKEVLDATLNFQIKQAQDGKAISDLLLEQADALIGIDMAVQNMNGMIAAFDFSMRQKENLLALWRRNEEFIEKYWTQKLPTHRIIQSEANIQLSRKLNEVAHYSFLASKALEYKFMQVLQGISLGALGLLNIADIFKCQTTSDFKDYLDKLQAYNVVECPGGTFQSHTYRVSLALNILGLTDENLGDIDGDGYIDATGIPVEDERFQKFQQFVNEHRDQNGNLVFTFTTSVYDQLLVQYQKANLKIWQGPIPCATSLNTKGMTAGLFFRGTSGSIFPVIHVAQKGVQPFLRKNHDLAGYYPVKTRALMNINDTAPEPFTQDYFTPFNGIDPRFQTGSMGEWTPAFTNRGVAATQWQVTLYVAPAEEGFDKVPLEKLKDLCFYLDTIGNNFEE